MFYSFNASDTASVVSYVGGIVGDFMPLILIILGVSIGLFVVSKIFKL